MKRYQDAIHEQNLSLYPLSRDFWKLLATNIKLGPIFFQALQYLKK